MAIAAARLRPSEANCQHMASAPAITTIWAAVSATGPQALNDRPSPTRVVMLRNSASSQP